MTLAMKASRVSGRSAESARSIASVSARSGPMWRGTNGAAFMSFSDERAVGCRVEKFSRLGGRGELDLHHPAGAVRILVNRFRGLFEGGIDLDDLARNRREEIGNGLHRLDRAERLALLDLLPLRREFDEHNVAQLALRVIGDADDAHGALGADPLVFV